jgi:hypothetical protein
MSMYHIYHLDSQTFSKWYSWWELIEYFFYCRKGHEFDCISHSIYKKDLFIEYYPIFHGTYCYPEKYAIEKRLYYRSEIVYDDDNRIVNLAELREGLKQYNPELSRKKINRNKGSYRFKSITNYKYLRYDPVPFTGKKRWRGNAYRWSIHNYRNYYLSVLSYEDEMKMDSKIKNDFYQHNSQWKDECLRSNYNNKSWKNEKKRKQWM